MHGELPLGTFNPRMFGFGVPVGRVEPIEPDPEKAHRCSRTVAVLGDNECRVNCLTNEVFNRKGGELWYVGRSSGDDDKDVERWAQWLLGMVGV